MQEDEYNFVIAAMMVLILDGNSEIGASRFFISI